MNANLLNVGSADENASNYRFIHDTDWRAADLVETDWRVPIAGPALAELTTMAGALADYDGPLDELRPDAFDWPDTTELVVDIKRRLDHGVGFAVLDRLPVEDWSETASRAVVWLLNRLVAPPIMQKHKGARLYDVRDTGTAMGYGVRRSITNLEQEFHTDGSFLKLTPDYLSLACIRQAETGGNSLVASLVRAHNTLLERHPEHLARLYQAYWWDRQAEHAPDEPPANSLPVFSRDGDLLSVRYYDDYIRNGYKLMNAEMDDAGHAALQAMREVVETPENRIAFRLEPGQIEFGNNRLVAHARTAFQDPEAPGHGRLLLRFWLRTQGGIGLEANPSPAV